MATTDTGESRAWDLLAASDPAAVCARAGVGFAAASGAYLVPSFGRRFAVAPGQRRILGLEPDGGSFLTRHAGLFRLSVLWYLVKAGPALPCGDLVKPASLPGGGIFTRGTHVLPLEALAANYAVRPGAFLSAGLALGGRAVAYGDAAVELPPFPKVPTTVILWAEDDEFPARADLLFDATGPQHLPLDILWSVAMLSLLPLL
jgi:hypothetical protein